MSLITIERTANLNGPIIPDTIAGVLNGGESDAHKFAITATRDGAQVALTGDVTASFLRADGAEVALAGQIEDGAATVTLAQSCYAVPGRFDLTIFVSAGGVTTGVYACTGGVRNTTAGTIVDPGQVVPSLAEIQALAASMRGTVAADTAYRAHLTGLRTLTDTATVFENKLIYAGGTNAGKLVTNVNYNCLIISVPSGVSSLAYTRYTATGPSTIGMCFWDGVATDDMPYGDLLKAERVAQNRPTGEEWETSIISVPTGAVYAGFTWRKSLGLKNFNVLDAMVYARSLEGRVAALEQAVAALTASTT